jgi:methylglutaconyl-CoA hydratase
VGGGVSDDKAGAGAATDELVQVAHDGAVATLTLDSPHNRNALSSRLVAQLLDALQGIRANPGIRVVVLTGAGRVFCSGADLAERLQAAEAPAGEVPGGDGAPSLPEVLAAMLALPQPVIARVNGHVRAGGMGLVAAADLAVAPASATFAFTEVRVGVSPAMIAVPALRVMDRRSFARYTLTGEVFGAPEAQRAGLLSAQVEDAALDRWVAEAVAAILQASPVAVAATKGLPEGLSGLDWDDAMSRAAALSDELFASPDAAEGMAAFLGKRSPSWAVEP